MAKIETPTCSECTQLNCYRRDKRAPKFCLTDAADQEMLSDSLSHYKDGSEDARLAYAAAEVEGLYYGKLTRVEETIAFAKRIGATKIGIASCLGLIEESRIYSKVLRLSGLEPYTVLCKIGSVDKCDIGIPDELKIKPGTHEACCNPILQAETLNAQGTQLNVIMGLCVGHDSLFIKHSDAPVTTLVTKDRVLGHNPAAVLYTSNFYGNRIMDAKRLKEL